MENTHVHISHSISRKKSGTLVFTSDFTGLGTDAAIRKSLSRLVHQGLLRRLAHGIYYILTLSWAKCDRQQKMWQQLLPAKKRYVSGLLGLRLTPPGLTTQVPARLVYITGGSSREFRVGKMPVKFKATTHKKLATIG